MSERNVDVVVIEGGPAGEVCAGPVPGAGLEWVLASARSSGHGRER